MLLLSASGFFFYLEKKKVITWRFTIPFDSWFLTKIKNTTELRLAFLDIGQGDATLITFPNQEKMLIDCARDRTVLSALGRNMHSYDRTIDYLVATHPDADHYGGCIDVLKRYRVRHIYFNGFDKEGSALLKEFHRTVQQEITDGGADLTIVTTTHYLEIASTTLHFLYPDHAIMLDPRVPGVKEIESNNTSIVTRISYGNHDILMTGDMEQPLEQYLLRSFGTTLQSEVLKVGHHGSISSSGEDFVKIVSPQYAIISVGKNNSYGHPANRVLARLERIKARVLRTDLLGDILMTISTSSIYINHGTTQ